MLWSDRSLRRRLYVPLALCLFASPTLAHGDYEVEGTVRVRGDTVRVESPTRTYTLDEGNRLTRKLERFEGLEVELMGDPPEGSHFDPGEMLSPRRTRVGGEIEWADASKSQLVLERSDGSTIDLLPRGRGRERILRWLRTYGVPVSLEVYPYPDRLLVHGAWFEANSKYTLLKDRPSRWSFPRGLVRGKGTEVLVKDRKNGHALVRGPMREDFGLIRRGKVGWVFWRELHPCAPQRGLTGSLPGR